VDSRDGHGLCSYDELRDFMCDRKCEYLAKYVVEDGGRYFLNEQEFSRVRLPSVKYQIACVFTLLGKYSLAADIHDLKWTDLSSWGDKVGNDLLKKFMIEYSG